MVSTPETGNNKIYALIYGWFLSDKRTVPQFRSIRLPLSMRTSVATEGLNGGYHHAIGCMPSRLIETGNTRSQWVNNGASAFDSSTVMHRMSKQLTIIEASKMAIKNNRILNGFLGRFALERALCSYKALMIARLFYTAVRQGEYTIALFRGPYTETAPWA